MQFKYNFSSPLVTLLLSFILFQTSTTLKAETINWPRLRGPNGLGIVETGGIPVTWESSDYRWKITLPGTGHASPVVWGNTIFVTCADEKKDIGYLIAVYEASGKIVWQKQFKLTGLGMHPDNSLATASPAVDENLVYLVWYSKAKTDLIAVNHQGDIQWRSEFDGIQAQHGGGSSLMLTRNFVVFTREQETGSSVSSSWVAVHKQTGKTAWELSRKTGSRNSFSTPMLIYPINQGEQLIFTSQTYGFTCINAQDGTVIWERQGLFNNRAVASPLYANGILFGCPNGQAFALPYNCETNQIEDSMLYSLPKNISPYVPTPVIVNDYVYTFVDNGTVACVRLSTGELLWKEKPADSIYGSPICVNRKLYCITRNGFVLVIQASPTYQLLGINALGEGSHSTPAMCESGMIFKTFSHLMIIGKE